MPRKPLPPTRIPPEFAPLWRDGDTLQFGMHGDVTVRVDAPWVERLISRLLHGIPMHAFDLIAHGVGAPREEARAMLARLRPVLRQDPPPPPPVRVDCLNVADSRVGFWMLSMLESLGVEESGPEDPAAVCVVLIHGTAAGVQLNPYLREDLAHLPVAFDRDMTTVGPLVIPGRSPCLACRDGYERDLDAAWPLLQCQRIGRDDADILPHAVGEAADAVVRLLAEPTEPGAEMRSRIVRISADGTRVHRSVPFHAECRCRESSFRSRPGTATASAPPDRLHSTRTA